MSYVLRDAEGRLVAHSHTKVAAHRTARRAKNAGGSVNRVSSAYACFSITTSAGNTYRVGGPAKQGLASRIGARIVGKSETYWPFSIVDANDREVMRGEMWPPGASQSHTNVWNAPGFSTTEKLEIMNLAWRKKYGWRATLAENITIPGVI